jgi:hypothetical protein
VIVDHLVVGSNPLTGSKTKGKTMNKYETYNTLQEPVKSFGDLLGRVLCRVEQIGQEELRFYLTESHYVRLYHEQSCCESVTIEDIVGDLDDLVGTPLLLVDESVSRKNNTADNNDDIDYYESESATWTFYRFRTIKGSVDIRWYGSSNGYYSESVDCEIVNLIN